MQYQYQILFNAPQAGEVAIASPSLNVKAIRGLAITQMVFGSIVIVLGIVSIGISSTYWVSQTGSGIWYGSWTLIAGIIGFFSARKPFSKSLIGTNMGFNIVCTVFSSLLVIFYSVTIGSIPYCIYMTNLERYLTEYKWCTNKEVILAIYSILLIMMVAEFAVSLTISILCCKGACCGNRMPNQMIGIAMQPPPQPHEIGQREIVQPDQSAIQQQPTLATLQQPNSGVITDATLQGATANDESQMNDE